MSPATVEKCALLALLLLIAIGRPAGSQSLSSTEPSEKFLGVPVYDPAAKRYFALMPSAKGSDGKWATEHADAEAHVYKGVRGRLAVVDTLEVHEFLLRHFHMPGPTWIGLRYLCRARKLEWSNGTLFKPGSFEAWDKNWKQDVFACSDTNNPNDWAPVAYLQTTKIGRASWRVRV